MNADQVLARVPRMTYRQLDYWCRQGWVDVGGRGSGVPRQFTADQAAELALVVDLVTDAQMSPSAAFAFVRAGSRLTLTGTGRALLIDDREHQDEQRDDDDRDDGADEHLSDDREEQTPVH